MPAATLLQSGNETADMLGFGAYGRDTPAKYLMTKKGLDKDAQMQLFGREYGEGAKKIMSWLTHRSTLEDPRIKSPSEPWMFCWEEVWDPHAETRDKVSSAHSTPRHTSHSPSNSRPLFPPLFHHLFFPPTSHPASGKIPVQHLVVT